MEKILVTGGTGYIGSHTIVELYKKGYEIDVLDNLFNSKITTLDKIEQLSGKRPNFHELDLRDYEGMDKLFAENHYDLVIHFAGLKAVAESVEKPLEYYENNVGGTVNLLKCMKNHGVHKIIFSSSATVYGDQGVAKLDETMQTGVGITNPYGETKHMIEEIMKDVAESDPEFSCTLLRYFNPVGNHESGIMGEDPNGIPNNLMPIVMKVAKGEIKELQVYGDDYPTPDGTCIRDYILGSGKGTSVKEMVEAFEKASGKPLPHVVVGRRAGDLAELIADPSKAERELNWKTELTVEDAMRDTIKFLANAN